MRERVFLPLIVLTAALVRLPFWLAASRAAVDGDMAIVGLMARHLGEGTTLWGQPYGSPLDAWVAAPFVAALGPTRAAVRLPYFVLSLALVPLTYALARALDPRAGLPAAFLMAFPPAYFLLLSVLPPPLYPTTLVLLGLILLLALRLGESIARGGRPWGGLILWGTISGLALWTHLISASVVAASGGYLWLRARGRRRMLLAALFPLLLASAPWWLRIGRDPSALLVLSVSSEGETFAGRLGRLLPQLHRPLLGLLGTHTPLTADDPDRVLFAPPWARLLLAGLYAAGLLAALRALRARPPAGLLVVALVLGLAAFPFSVRAEPHTLRFLTPLYLPLAVLLVSHAASGRVRRAWLLVLALSALHLIAGARLLEAWRGAGPSDLTPDCAPVREALERLGIRRAYASYNPAYCLTYESGETTVASQPWNERFLGYPLRYLDEVRFARRVAWVLMPGMDFELPSPRHFEAKLQAAGGGWSRTEAGAAVIYHSFAPPFPPTVTPLAAAGPAGDGDLDTRTSHPPRGPTTFTLPAPASLSALTLVAGKGDLRLPRTMTVEVSADGLVFERVARRRPGRELIDLAWVNGHPQYVIDQDLLAIPLGGRTVAAVRITPGGSQPWATEEVLLHGPGPSAPWDDWLDADLTWEGRKRALADRPRPDREDWYYRSILAGRRR